MFVAYNARLAVGHNHTVFLDEFRRAKSCCSFCFNGQFPYRASRADLRAYRAIVRTVGVSVVQGRLKRFEPSLPVFYRLGQDFCRTSCDAQTAAGTEFPESFHGIRPRRDDHGIFLDHRDQTPGPLGQRFGYV